MEAKTTVSTAELRPLVSALKNEMQKKGYSPLSMRGLENVWDALLHYASTVPATAFDENFREGFLQTEYGLRMDLEYTMYRASRALELLKNYIEFGVVTGVPKKQRREFSDAYRPLMTAFSDGEARRGLAEGTMKSLWSRLYRLYLFLTDKGADTFSMVTRDMINDFIKYLAPYSTTYVSENLRMLRRLSLYAFQNGYHAEDLSGCIPAVKNSRQQTEGFSPALLAALEQQTAPAVLATIVGRHGSTPREEGSKMLVLPDGSAVGSVGGGIMEYRTQQLARELLEPGAAPCRLAAFTTEGASDAAAIAACGGSMEVFLQRLEPEE